jgi:hypothetical protein
MTTSSGAPVKASQYLGHSSSMTEHHPNNHLVWLMLKFPASPGTTGHPWKTPFYKIAAPIGKVQVEGPAQKARPVNETQHPANYAAQ